MPKVFGDVLFPSCTTCFERVTAKLFFELLPSLLILSLPVFCFVFYISLLTLPLLLQLSLVDLFSLPVQFATGPRPTHHQVIVPSSLFRFLRNLSHLFHLLKQLTFHLHFDTVTQKNISSSSIMLYLNLGFSISIDMHFIWCCMDGN